MLAGDKLGSYFNAILIRSDTVETKETSLKVVPFEKSVMGRHYLIQPIKFFNAKIVLMTSHLESCGEYSGERKRQFSEILDYIKRQNENFNVIFGGDTNLRDKEVKNLGGIPIGIFDAWESCGSELTTKYTWNMAENDNLGREFRPPPKLRFDRIFIRPAKGETAIRPNSFSLIGKERLGNCGRFPSDHWGIWLDLRVE